MQASVEQREVDQMGPQGLCDALSSFGDRLLVAAEAGERCSERRCLLPKKELWRMEKRAKMLLSVPEVRKRRREAPEFLRCMGGAYDWPLYTSDAHEQE